MNRAADAPFLAGSSCFPLSCPPMFTLLWTFSCVLLSCLRTTDHVYRFFALALSTVIFSLASFRFILTCPYFAGMTTMEPKWRAGADRAQEAEYFGVMEGQPGWLTIIFAAHSTLCTRDGAHVVGLLAPAGLETLCLGRIRRIAARQARDGEFAVAAAGGCKWMQIFAAGFVARSQL
jgi:hypothetical protein